MIFKNIHYYIFCQNKIFKFIKYKKFNLDFNLYLLNEP